MPRGLSKIKQVAAENAAKRAAYEQGGGGGRFLKLDDGDTAKVRFLEQGEEVWYVWAHQLPKQPGRGFGDWVQCLDQDDKGEACPGCERSKTRSARVCINLIWYDAPKLKRDKDGKAVKDENDNYIVDGKEDTVVTWVRGSTDGGRLEHLDSKYGGLTAHIFTISREGKTKDTTKYHIDIDEQNKPPSPSDSELFAKKPDPRKGVKEMTYGDMARAYSGGGQAEAPQSGMGQPQPDADMSDNVFAKSAAGAINRGAFGE